MSAVIGSSRFRFGFISNEVDVDVVLDSVDVNNHGAIQMLIGRAE